MRRALYTGSFDPLTYGHLDLIERAAEMFDELTVGVIINPNKNPLFSEQERVELIERAVKDIGNIKVTSFSGLLADFVNKNNFNAVVRGLRATTDFEYEIQMAQMNARLFSKGTESVFLMTRPEYSFISSSVLKEVVSLGGCAEGLAPKFILDETVEKIKCIKKREGKNERQGNCS